MIGAEPTSASNTRKFIDAVLPGPVAMHLPKAPTSGGPLHPDRAATLAGVAGELNISRAEAPTGALS
jgi:hypothetical protein